MAVDISDPKVLDKMSRNARKWARYLEENLANDEILARKAFGRVRNIIFHVIRQNLLNAIQKTKEFDIPELKIPLLANFSDPDLLEVNFETNKITNHAKQIAGDWSDFYDGVQAAREQLDIDTDEPLATRAEFWKVFVYKPAREGINPPSRDASTSQRKGREAENYYYRMIRARTSAWRGQTPYWLWLENGTWHRKGSYPRYGGTKFLQTSMTEAQLLFDRELFRVREENQQAINRALERFLDNPTEFAPEEELGTFIAEGKEFSIYVTPKKRLLGVSGTR